MRVDAAEKALITKTWLVVCVALSAAMLAGCRSGGGQSASEACATQARARAPFAYGGTSHAAGATVRIETRDDEFAPTCILDVPAGAVTVVLHNVGTERHNFSVASQHIDRDIAPGATVSVRVTVGRSNVVFVCKYHRASGMVGALVANTGNDTGTT